ncbi:MAG TPA: chemotaxis protein CheW [Ktedonobacterales bacterium]|nr:chemotaxis protein CheW [Ktedonobacterales bacterium]
MSDRQDRPGGESIRPLGAAGRPHDNEDAFGFNRWADTKEPGSQSSGAIIPFEPFARRKTGGLDPEQYFAGTSSSLSSSMLSASFAGGQLALRGTVNSPFGNEENVEDLGEQYLIFSLENFECAFKAEDVQAVERLPEVTPVPNVAYWIDGVIHSRGHIVSVVDLRSFLGMERQPPSSRTRLVIGRVGELAIGLVVDGVSEMRGILPNMIQLQQIMRALPGWATPYVTGIASVGVRSILLIDMERLLLSEKMHRYQSGN